MKTTSLGTMGISKSILLIGLLLLHHATWAAEKIRVALSGDELLVAAVDAPGERQGTAAGIYAFGREPTPTLVVPGGSAPAWSPDRRRFAFLRPGGGVGGPQRVVCIADCRTRVVREISPASAAGLSWEPVPRFGERGMLSPPIHWLAEGRGLLLLASHMGGSAWHRLPVPADDQPTQELPEPITPVVAGVRHGRAAVRADGAIAFERLQMRSGLGCVSRDVAVLLPGAESPVAMDMRGLPAGCMALNPHWRPGSSELSVDVVTPADTREVYLVAVDNGKTAPEKLAPLEPKGGSWATADWSPDGKSVVLCFWCSDGYGGPYALYWPKPEDAPEGEQLLHLGGRVAFAARFSPDGRRVAHLHGDCGADGEVPVDGDLLLLERIHKEGPAGFRFLPRGVVPASLDW